MDPRTGSESGFRTTVSVPCQATRAGDERSCRIFWHVSLCSNREQPLHATTERWYVKQSAAERGPELSATACSTAEVDEPTAETTSG